jgi:hypothetical protein
MSSNVRSFHFSYFQEKNKTIIIIHNKPVPGITKLSTQQNRASILQLALTATLLIGWCWSIVWGNYYVEMSGTIWQHCIKRSFQYLEGQGDSICCVTENCIPRPIKKYYQRYDGVLFKYIVNFVMIHKFEACI